MALLAKLWNGLSNLALHVALPRSKTDPVEQFGDPALIRAKVEESLIELERIATGSLTSTGFGPEVSFSCDCGMRNKRKSERLHAGKVIHCINPKCEHSFEIEPEGETFNFVVRWVHVDCTCGRSLRFAKAPLERLQVNETARSICECGTESVFHWRLYHGVRATSGSTD